MKQICMFCQTHYGTVPGGDMDTHGICPECFTWSGAREANSCVVAVKALLLRGVNPGPTAVTFILAALRDWACKIYHSGVLRYAQREMILRAHQTYKEVQARWCKPEFLTSVEQLQPYLGTVVKVWWCKEWGWLYHRLGTKFEYFSELSPEEFGVRSTMQVHNGMHGDFELTTARFNAGMKVIAVSDPSEYAAVRFSYER